MTHPQWERVRAVFEKLVDVDLAEAERRLDEECGDDPAIRSEVRSLLLHHSRAGSFLAEPPSIDSVDEGRELTPGVAVGPYTVMREVGHGGMGRVYLAEDTRLRRQVSLKVIRADLADNPQYRERLRREARLAASLSHPGICAVYALEEIEEQLYLITEFVEGRTLREEIRDDLRPSSADIVETVRQLSAALAAAHAKGITHRDLKPENVMRSTQGGLKILDFGLARGEAEPTSAMMATMPGVLVGTPAYMSPEQINGGPADRRADLFAFGVLLYEYATGRHPFAAPSALATAARIVNQQPESLRQLRQDLPLNVIEVIERCLEKDPSDRFATANEMLMALDSAPRSRGMDQPGRWWQVHQYAAMALYFTACAAAWLLKEWSADSAGRWMFVGIGACAAINGVVRGHLLFTAHARPRRFLPEYHRVRRTLLVLDLVIAAVLVGMAGFVVDGRPVAAVLVIGLAAGIGLAAAFIEPVTTAAAFDQS
jgi:serine/threonine protein kinase